MQQLMSKLAEHNYIEWHRSKDETDTIRDIFWTHPIAVHLLQTFFVYYLWIAHTKLTGIVYLR